MTMQVLAIESSTSSAKAFLYDTETKAVTSARKSYGALHRSGMTDTEGVFRLTMGIARELAQGRDVAAIALCGTWHGLCAVDREWKPACPTYSWDFLDTAPYVERIQKDGALTDIFYRRTGCMPHNTYPRHILSYLRDRGMDMEKHRFMTQGAYHFYRLTGEFRESRCTQSGSGLINLDSMEYDEFVLNYFGIRKDQLGALCTYQDVAPLSREGADLLGLRPGIPVVPAHADGALNQLGNFAHRPGVMTMSVGTSGAMRMVADRPILPENRGLWCYLGVEGYISGAAISGACNCVDWFRKTLLGGRVSFTELERGAEQEREIPVFLPFLFSERCPGWRSERRGGFLEVDGSHTAADLYKAVQVGILMNMLQCYRILSAENREPEEILLSGGIANSAVWTQMAADIFQRELLVMDCPDASTMGAVALALYTAGNLEKVGDFRADYDKAVRVRPDEERYSYYRKQYERYLDAYQKSGEREI